MHRQSISAFGSFLLELGHHGQPGLSVGEICDVQIAVVMACNGSQERAQERLTSLAAVTPIQLVPIGPGHWLLLSKEPSTTWIDSLSDALGDSAEVFDQTSGYGLLELVGRDGQTILQKGIFADLANLLAADGDSICSVIAHIGITVWRSGTDSLVVAVPRSFASSFWHWLMASAAAENITLQHRV